jgi:hypothetical protein
MVDAFDLLWVEKYRRPGDDRSQWIAFDTTGLVAAEIVLPPRFSLLEAGADYVLGGWRDADDAVRLRAHRLVRR